LFILQTTSPRDSESLKIKIPEKRKTDDNDQIKELKKVSESNLSYIYIISLLSIYHNIVIL